MGVETFKSTLVTNFESPGTLSKPGVGGGVIRRFVATMETAAANDDGSKQLAVRVHSSWTIDRIQIINDAVTGMTGVDCGLYQTTANGGAAVDDDLWAQGVDIAAGNATPLDITFERLDKADIEKAIWEILGLDEDPNLDYLLALTFDTMGSGVGTISLRVYAITGV